MRIIVKGIVQGVFFRHSTRLKARGLGINGFVRNKEDGSVEVFAEGDEQALQELIQFCREGPPGAMVSSVELKEEPYKHEFSGFEIRY